jgi:hypothetical protein
MSLNVTSLNVRVSKRKSFRTQEFQNLKVKKRKDATVVSVIDAYVLYLLRFVKATLCAATFSNSYVMWRKRCVMLRFVAVP